MNIGLWTVFTTSILFCCRCSNVEVAPELATVYARMVEAAKIKDAGVLYDLSIPELHDEFVNLLKRMKNLEDAIITVYPASDHHSLRQDLGLSYSESCQDARCLFVNVADFSGIVVDSDVNDGFAIVDVVQSDNIAEIQTRGGERFRFRHTEDGTWMATLPWDAYQAWKDRDRWLSNLTQAEQNVEQLRRRVDEQRDPRTPEGAINLFRDSVAENNVDALFTLLDDETKKYLGQIVRNAQSAESETPDTPAWKLARTSQNGRELFEALWRQKLVGDDMPQPGDKIIRIERDTRATVVGVLAGDRQVRLVRGKQDIWRISDLNRTLVRLFSGTQLEP
ncbi:MAG: hypothetical protein HUU55_23865 [Myxococcales bacterium]|nr:hypothetical protein [Myxococcales bacterium]